MTSSRLCPLCQGARELADAEDAAPQKQFLTWGEAIKLAAASYEKLEREFEEALEKEIAYWQFRDEDDTGEWTDDDGTNRQ